jgi:hypothetical protein
VSQGERAPGGGHGTCRSCQAPIVWFKTRAGKNIPINADTVKPEDLQLDLPRHIAHFANCPQANQHRRLR